jgi:hypothetical protein
VLSQDPEAGSDAEVGSALLAVVSGGPEQEIQKGVMPDVVFHTMDYAVGALEEAEIEYEVEYEESDHILRGNVVEQEFPAGDSPILVKITVSEGSEKQDEALGKLPGGGPGGELANNQEAAPPAIDIDAGPAMEYYAEELGKFLALGKSAITVMLKDIDGDGFEEMLTYWQEEVDDPFGEGFGPDINYSLDIFDYKDSQMLHFTEEKTEFYPYAHSNVFFITAANYLVYATSGGDIGQYPGFVYDHSYPHSISGGMYDWDWPRDATFDGATISEEEFKAVCQKYAIPLDEYNMQDGSGLRIVGYEHTRGHERKHVWSCVGGRRRLVDGLVRGCRSGRRRVD